MPTLSKKYFMARKKLPDGTWYYKPTASTHATPKLYLHAKVAKAAGGKDYEAVEVTLLIWEPD